MCEETQLEQMTKSRSMDVLSARELGGGGGGGGGGVKKTVTHMSREASVEGSLQVLAAQTFRIASMNGQLGELDKLEDDLEEEIRYENRSPAKTSIGRIRRNGQHHIHSKPVLLVVVLLNIIDCLLVMAELTLDFHYVSQQLSAKDDMLSSFTDNMEEKYSLHLHDTGEEADGHLLQKVLDAHIIFNVTSSSHNMTDLAQECVHYLNTTATGVGQSLSSYVTTLHLLDYNWSTASTCFQMYPSFNQSGGDEGRSYTLSSTGKVEEKLINVAHKLHYISVSILGVLVIFCVFKIICGGKRFFKSRMQVFDSIIVVISFILDLVFIEGLTILPHQDFVIILTLLLPWRIIRVLNSLIVAVLDKQRLNLKIIYTQKKKIARTLTETNNKVDVLQRHVQVLQNLCTSRGMGDGEVQKFLHKSSSSSNQKNGGGGGLSVALGKLAFQAADAFAPMTNSLHKLDKINNSAPILSAGDTTQPKVDGEQKQDYRHAESSPTLLHETETHTDSNNHNHNHITGEERKTSHSLPDLAQDDRYVNDTDHISRL